MSRPFIKAVEIEHYRALDALKIQGLRRLNIIGGVNGTGKTTLLEALFSFADYLGPFPALRPFSLRQLPGTYSSSKNVLFSKENNFSYTMKVETRVGTFTSTVQWLSNVSVQPSQITQENAERSDQSFGSSDGVSQILTKDGIVILNRLYTSAAGGFAFKDEILYRESPPPPCTFLSKNTFSVDAEQRFSNVVQNGKKRQILSIVKRLSPTVSDLLILQPAGDKSLLCCEFEDGTISPISFAGDGAANLAAVSMAIMASRNGIVFLDEFDASIHYSKLEDVWRIVHELACEYDCQIFAASHSLESIYAAARAFKDRNHEDFQYVRLNRSDSKTIATNYSRDEIESAEFSEWEVR